MNISVSTLEKTHQVHFEAAKKQEPTRASERFKVDFHGFPIPIVFSHLYTFVEFPFPSQGLQPCCWKLNHL